jgi:hypothetical protein
VRECTLPRVCAGCDKGERAVLEHADAVRACASCYTAALCVVYRARLNGGVLTAQDAAWVENVERGTVAAAHRIGRRALEQLGAAWPALELRPAVAIFDRLERVSLGPRQRRQRA